MDITVVILAAGKGERMKSSIPKVLNKIAGATFLEILLTTLAKMKIKDLRLVVSDEVKNHDGFKRLEEKFLFKTYLQTERLGTADALKCGLRDNTKFPISVLNGDCPLIEIASLEGIYKFYHLNNPDLLVVGFESNNPSGYGRMLTYGEDLIEIIEDRDATDKQKEIKLCNSGIYMINHKNAYELLDKIQNANSAKEFYLTDIVRIANHQSLKVSYIEVNKKEVIGINNQKQKVAAEKILQNNLRRDALKKGVNITDPDKVYLSFDTELEPSVTLQPFVVLGNNVSIKEGAEIMSFSHIEGAKIGANCRIGPFARIRPLTNIEENSKVGNFVEIKTSMIGKEVKISHMSYVGDTTIEDNVNIGAGTVFCNYDGYSKHQSHIGKGSFIGSNSSLIAPINIGEGSIVGAGSVITEDIEDNALSIGRSKQINFKQKAEIIRKKKRSESTSD
jgi:bifunctional UDP-N-acetylglucosamine pyrophosphorylase / glucosamine-1-phosphate N-acetyltransferase